MFTPDAYSSDDPNAPINVVVKKKAKEVATAAVVIKQEVKDTGKDTYISAWSPHPEPHAWGPIFMEIACHLIDVERAMRKQLQERFPDQVRKQMTWTVPESCPVAYVPVVATAVSERTTMP